jgi:hypothetical protein
MKAIKINEPQPSPCPKCGGYEGYRYYDQYKMHYATTHSADGKYAGGQIEMGRLIHKAVTAYCINCGSRLDFKLVREDCETIEP